MIMIKRIWAKKSFLFIDCLVVVLVVLIAVIQWIHATGICNRRCHLYEDRCLQLWGSPPGDNQRSPESRAIP